MPNLAPVDLMILLIYFFFVVSCGVGLKQFTAGGAEFLLAKRSMPGWLCGLAYAAAGLGSLEVLGMGAAGARWGLVSASFFGLGAVIPLLFAALFLVPVFYASKARSLPGYLGLRFDGKTRALAAAISLVGFVVSAALALYAMARVSASLRLFEMMFHLNRMTPPQILVVSVLLPAVIVLAYVSLGGLGATMYAQVMQLFVLVLGFLPMVYLGLKQAGGWGGMKSGFATALAGGWAPTGAGAVGMAILLGVVLMAGAACADFSQLQNSFAAANARAAQRAPLIAAAWKAVLPLLLVVPGVIAVSLPTPQTAITVSNANGEITHEITVVPHAQELGRGLAPAETDSIADPMTGNVLRDQNGHPRIDFGMATPGLLPHNLPTGLLGLAIAALLACLTGGVAGRVAAFNNVFVYDVYQPYFKKEANEKHLAAVGRWTTLGVVAVAALLALGALRLHSMPGLLELLALSSAVLLAPMVGAILLGVLWKRANGCGGFGALVAGVIAALVHWGVTLPPGYQRGIAGGWISAMHHPSILRQAGGGAMLSIVISLLVGVVLSWMTGARPEAELAGLVYNAGQVAEQSLWQRPAVVAVLILLLALAVSLGIALA